MNKIVRRRYPVALLPEDLREGLASTTVTVVVTEEGAEAARGPVSLEQLKAIRDSLPVATDDPAARIRALRDEWD